MQRITISLEDGLAEALDEFLTSRAYKSRSEGVRDMVRARFRCSQFRARTARSVVPPHL